MARLDRDNAFYNYVAPTPTIDVSDAAEKARTKAMSKANAASRPQTFLEQVESQIAKTTARISTLENTATELGAINPDVMTKFEGESNSAFLKRKQAAEKLARQNAIAENPLLNKAVKPTDAPAGKYYAWIGGTDTGQWQLYDIPGYSGTTSVTSSSSTVDTITPTQVTSPTATLVSTETDAYGNVIGVYSDGTTKTLIASGNKYKSTVDVDAYTLLESTFKDYGLEDLIPDIKRFMEEGLGSNQAAIELKKTTAYITRFRGNEIRRQAGLNVVSEAEYLQLENAYNETLRAYGLQGYFGTDRKVSQSKMADIIGNDISATEFKDRIDTVVTRVNNADPNVKATLKSFYNIQDTDLVGYFLNPKENLPKLQEKVLSAEIGSEAIKQNLLTDVSSATALAQLGITKAQAREGYQGIANVLPTTTKLGQIYGEEGINYTQKTAEEEVFGQLESAKRKRLKLAEKEVGTFSGAAGLGRGALGSGKSSTF
ncbi:MAG: hypothetical protein EBU08_14050 [Micrococcales bacterium]|nr:hypothetical protein [Micrococcales bacterium]